LGAKKPAEAEAEFRQALAIEQKLVDDNPTYPQFRTELAETMTRIGRVMMDLAMPADPFVR
jgi:hypothetical protein